MTFPEKTLHDLEWSRLLDHLAARCRGEEAADRCRVLPFMDASRAQAHLELVQEFLKCIENDDPPPSLSALPVAQALALVRGRGSVPGEALRAVAVNLKLFTALHRYLDNRVDVCPKNMTLVLPDPDRISTIGLARLAGEIESAFEPDGAISDLASQQIGLLRRRVVSIRKRLLARIDEIAESHDDLLSDRTVSIRNDRFVLPVRTDAHRPLKGIVHGTSGTGNTIFVEPEQAVDLGNDLMLARESVTREEARILAELRDAVYDHLEEVTHACEAIVDTETRIAAARLSFDLEASVPCDGPAGTMELSHARHPLLVLEGVSVVPSRITVSPGGCLLISGPNAGGKTVVLKTVGLAGLMLAAGLPIPADSESSVGIPTNVLTDIGDDQSLELNLSTFSAHMKNIGGILDSVGAGDIVLLDELCAGTDPIEGTALAEAILDSLIKLGTSTLATTHFDTLKTRAQNKEHFVNGAMSFDVDAGKPTFELRMGVPGSSSALTIAARFGIPDRILDHARKLLPDGVRELSNTVEALERERLLANQERHALAQQRMMLEEARRSHMAELDGLRSRQDKFVDKETEVLWSAIRRAREKVRDAEVSIRRHRTDQTALRKTQDTINKVATDLEMGGDLSKNKREDLRGVPARPQDLEPGVKVLVTTLDKEAEVDSPVQGNTIFVRAGSLRLRVNIEELNVLAKKETGRAKSGRKITLPREPDRETQDVIRTSQNTLDLRGKTVDEAIDATETFLDTSMRDDTDVVFILHGHGTGALRDAVRAYLENSQYVSQSRSGNRAEGGDGITAVWIR
jgi:DNA mismatch repair protein MutS2